MDAREADNQTDLDPSDEVRSDLALAPEAFANREHTAFQPQGLCSSLCELA